MTDVQTFEGVRLRIIGTPTAQGSKVGYVDKRSGRVVMREESNTNPTRKVWRSAVVEEAEATRITFGRALDGPLVVNATFRFAMPTSRPKHLRERGYARRSTKPDIDKLLRALFDALTESGLIADDARIAEVTARKTEVGTGQWTGAEVVVRETSP